MLAIRPHKDVLEEEMYACEKDGYPASYAEAKDVFVEERRRMDLLGRSETLITQAAFWHSQGDEHLAEKTLAEGERWGEAERQVAIQAALGRVKIVQNPDFTKSGPWAEMKRVDELGKLGDEVAVVDYPIIKVAYVLNGFDIELGKPEFLNQKANANAAIVKGLIGASMKVDRISSPWDLDQKYRPDMRIYWSHKNGGVTEWGGKDIFALGIIRAF